MADYSKRKYYWIKLTDHFLTSETVDFLLSQKDGANYVVLYQILCLKSVNTDGLLASKIGEILVPFNEEKIQRDCKHFSIDTIRVALELYKKLGLVYVEENGMLRISRFERLIGSQTEGARRKEIQRSKVDSGVDICPPEIKILDIRDKDSKENIIKENDVSKMYTSDISTIISYLNEKAHTKYRTSSESTRRHIIARLKEQYTVDDFKKVIDKKVNEWRGSEMEKYLRPDTLFGTKFEIYLNQQIRKSAADAGNFEQRDYSEEEMAAVMISANDIDKIEW